MVKRSNNLWNTSDLVEHYGVSRQTVSNWVKKDCPCYIIGPKKFKFDPELVEEWLKSRSAQKKLEV